jgi:nucleotidyltransferase/DNA polymerase involved in DNA repair
MQRVMCILIRDWPIQRLALARPQLHGRAVVLYEASPQGGLKVLAATSALRPGLSPAGPPGLITGLYPGMPLAEAAALLAHAQAAAASLEPHIEPADPDADFIGLVQLAQWAQRFSPISGVADAPRPDCLLLDVSGLGHLFGGEQALAEEVHREFAARGLSVRVALADTIGAAWAAAHAEVFLQILPPGESLSVLAPLPIGYLRVAEETAALLATLGICRIGQLAALPRWALLSRFGPDLLRRLDQALGRAPEMIAACHQAPQYAAEFAFEAPLANREAIERVLGQLIARLTGLLSQRREGVLSLLCRLHYERAFEEDARPEGPKGNSPDHKVGDHGQSIHRTRPEGPTQATHEMSVLRTLPPASHDLTLPLRAGLLPAGPPGLMLSQFGAWTTEKNSLTFCIGLFRASASAEYLCDLLRLRLESVRLAGPVTSVQVEVTAVGPLELRQQGLFDSDSQPDHPRRLARLVDRLSNRLGRGAVVQTALLADAQPEYTCIDVPLAGGAMTSVGNARSLPATAGKLRASSRRSLQKKSGKKNLTHIRRYGLLSFAPDERPLELLRQPARIEIVAIDPHGAPARFRFAGCGHQVAYAWGPERIETGWWRTARGEQNARKTLVRRDYYRVESTSGARFWIFRQLGSPQWFLHGRFV